MKTGEVFNLCLIPMVNCLICLTIK